MPMKVSIIGSAGRMGRTIAQGLRARGDVIAAEADAGDDLVAAVEAGEVVIDFSFHTATRSVIEAAVRAGRALVIGTTGHSVEERNALRELARGTRTVWAGNFSVGVNLLFFLVQRAAASLPADYDVEIVEMHHRLKKDAPSGTAERLLELVLAPHGRARSDVVHGRHGITGERPPRQVGMHALRGGDVVGDHTVLFAGSGERLELTHRATDRAVFAGGAIHAAHWVVKQPPGLYDMQDVLGLKS